MNTEHIQTMGLDLQLSLSRFSPVIVAVSVALLISYQGLSQLWLYLIVALLLCLSLVWLHGIYTWSSNKWEIHSAMNKFPSPTKHWIYGNLHEIPHPGETELKWRYKLTQIYSRLVVLWYGSLYPILCVTHPDTCKKIMMSTLPKMITEGGQYSNLLPWLGYGLLNSSGPKWFRNRRLLTPAFHFEVLKPHMDIFNKSTDTLLNRFSECSDTGQSMDIFHSISLSTLNVILKCAFSYEVDVQTESENNVYLENINKLTGLLRQKFRKQWMGDFLYSMTSSGKQFHKCIQNLHNVSSEVIQKRKRALANVKKSGHPDFLDILLLARDELGKGLTDEEIRAEVDTFLFEGHDTTASAISWSLYALAEHPDHQEKCYQEISEMLSGRDTPNIMWDDLGNMPYTTRCIKEALRIHSPVPTVGREVDKEFEIDGVRMPVGSRIQVHIHALHHNQEIWGADHEDFKPERFELTDANQRDSFAFLPFAAGARNCIGQNFAMNEIKVMVAKTLFKFKLSIDPDRPAKHLIAAVMRAEKGVHVFFSRRD